MQCPVSSQYSIDTHYDRLHEHMIRREATLVPGCQWGNVENDFIEEEQNVYDSGRLFRSRV